MNLIWVVSRDSNALARVNSLAREHPRAGRGVDAAWTRGDGRGRAGTGADAGRALMRARVQHLAGVGALQTSSK